MRTPRPRSASTTGRRGTVDATASEPTAEDALRRYRTIFEGASIGIMRLDATGRVVEANPAIEQMLRYSATELRDLRFEEYTHADDVVENLRLFREIMSGPSDTYRFEKRCIRRDGVTIWVHVTAVAERDATGARRYAMTMLEDITARKLAEQAYLEQARLNEYQALHDALTGLANRRQLTRDLGLASADATVERPVQLVVFDLDGFKAYNDAFGHHGGDLLLTRLARSLATAIAAHGTCYRLGGDEFCALFREPADDAVVRACVAALSDSGTGFTIACSHGSVLLPSETSDPEFAMQLADERMYREKGSSRTSAGEQTRSLALKVLSVQEPGVELHSAQVAGLAGEVARRLGLTPSECADVVRAAELHDIGKIAIPFAILHKPGPLDDSEWEMMRRHPTVGANILGVAPALRRVAEIVRSSHERFDGLGYPAGLAGLEIPIGSRIVFVCDSFDAMVSDRGYSAAMREEAVLAELQRNAGTQFDPAVVDAFCAERAAAEDGDGELSRPVLLA